jgi:hypothetical protein
MSSFALAAGVGVPIPTFCAFKKREEKTDRIIKLILISTYLRY